jgi:hypothetical protein
VPYRSAAVPSVVTVAFCVAMTDLAVDLDDDTSFRLFEVASDRPCHAGVRDSQEMSRRRRASVSRSTAPACRFTGAPQVLSTAHSSTVLAMGEPAGVMTPPGSPMAFAES